MALYKRVIGLDVHQARITACALIEEADRTMRIEQRQFGAFRRDRRALAEWAAALEAAGIRAKVVNARHVKNVPGRKTDVGDAQ